MNSLPTPCFVSVCTCVFPCCHAALPGFTDYISQRQMHTDYYTCAATMGTNYVVFIGC